MVGGNLSIYPSIMSASLLAPYKAIVANLSSQFEKAKAKGDLNSYESVMNEVEDDGVRVRLSLSLSLHLLFLLLHFYYYFFGQNTSHKLIPFFVSFVGKTSLKLESALRSKRNGPRNQRKNRRSDKSHQTRSKDRTTPSSSWVKSVRKKAGKRWWLC